MRFITALHKYWSKPIPPTLALMRFDGIGDYLLLRPFFPFLKNSKKYAHYRFILVGRNNFIPLAQKYDADYFDHIYWVNYPPKAADFSALVKNLKSHHITELISPTGCIEPEFAVQLFTRIPAAAKTAAACYASGGAQLDLYYRTTTRVIHTQPGPHSPLEFFRYKSFFEQLIEEPIPLDAPRWHLPLEKLPARAPVTGSFALLAPHTSNANKNITPQTAVCCARHILENYPVERLLIVGENCSEIKQLIEEIHSPRCVSYTPPSICHTIPLIQRADFIVTTDTSFLHLGAQLGTKTVYLAGSCSYGVFHPYPATFTHVKGIYPPGMQEKIAQIDIRSYLPQYDVKQIPISYLLAELDDFLQPK